MMIMMMMIMARVSLKGFSNQSFLPTFSRRCSRRALAVPPFDARNSLSRRCSIGSSWQTLLSFLKSAPMRITSGRRVEWKCSSPLSSSEIKLSPNDFNGGGDRLRLFSFFLESTWRSSPVFWSVSRGATSALLRLLRRPDFIRMMKRRCNPQSKELREGGNLGIGEGREQTGKKVGRWVLSQSESFPENLSPVNLQPNETAPS